MTEFAETAVLIAVMEDDQGEAVRRLRDFLPGELRTFKRQAENLCAAIEYAQFEQEKRGDQT